MEGNKSLHIGVLAIVGGILGLLLWLFFGVRDLRPVSQTPASTNATATVVAAIPVDANPPMTKSSTPPSPRAGSSASSASGPAAETVGIYSNETYTDKNLGLQIKATDFPDYAFTGLVTVGSGSAPISMTLGQTVPIFGYEIKLVSIATQNNGFVNGAPITSNYATLTIEGP